MHYLYAKEWGIDELVFVDAYDSRSEAQSMRRWYQENHPEDSMGWPCRYIVSKEPPPERISYEQASAAGLN
jgi:hypothetical protein